MTHRKQHRAQMGNDPKVVPCYQSQGRKAPTRRVLSGNIFVFGAGQMIHENLLFSFSQAERITLYDPYEQTPCPAKNMSYHGGYRGFENAIASTQGDIDTILCLFSLHFAPEWLRKLECLFSRLKVGGSLFISEDHGFRALLDDGFVDSTAADIMPNDLQKLVRDSFRKRSLEGLVPWRPDISASNSRLIRTILALVADEQLVETLHLTRTLQPEAEPHCYLPWKPSFCPAEHANEVSTALSKLKRVPEVIEVREFKKRCEMPNLDRVDEPMVLAIWSAVTATARANLSSVMVTEDAVLFCKSFLTLAYLNLLRHVSCVASCEVLIGMSGFLERDPGVASSNLDSTLEHAVFMHGNSLDLRFERPRWVADYLHLAKGDYLVADLWKSWREKPTALYLWDPPKWELKPSAFRRSPPWSEVTFVRDIPQLLQRYNFLGPPPCVHALEALGVKNNRLALMGAAVLYFEEGNPLLPADLGVALYLFQAMMPTLAGRAAFLELAIQRQEIVNERVARERVAARLGHVGHVINNMAVLSSIQTARDMLAQAMGTTGALGVDAGKIDEKLDDAERAYKTIGQALAAARFDNRRIEVRRLLQEIVDELPRYATIKLDLSEDETSPEISKGLGFIAFWNLIFNAIKYTEKKSAQVAAQIFESSGQRYYDVTVRNAEAMPPDAIGVINGTHLPRSTQQGLREVRNAVAELGGTVKCWVDEMNMTHVLVRVRFP